MANAWGGLWGTSWGSVWGKTTGVWSGSWGESWGDSWSLAKAPTAVHATLDVTEAADTLESVATIADAENISFPGRQRPPRRQLQPIIASLDVTEAADTCEAIGLVEFSAITIDNDWLLAA